MRASAYGLFLLLSTFPLLAAPGPQPDQGSKLGKSSRLDKGQCESAMRLIQGGETVRLFCKSCTDVVYTSLKVETRALQPIGDKFEFLLNGQAVDAGELYVDSGFGDGWDNLAELLGFVPKDSAPKLSRALDDITKLTPHIGLYTGTLGDQSARLELVLEGRRVTGFLNLGSSHTEPATDRPLRATVFNATRQSNTITLVERDANNNLAATLSGRLDAEGHTFIGTRSPLDGSSAESFQLFRAAKAP